MKKFKIIFLYIILVLAFASCRVTKSAKKSPVSSSEKGYEQLSEKQKLDFAYHFFDANKEEILGNYEKAAELYRRAIQANKYSAASHYKLGILYHSKGDNKNAEMLGKEAINLDPKNEWYQLFYAETLKSNKKYTEAIKVYEKLVKDYPERIDFYYNWASTFILAGKYEDAIKVYNLLEKQIGVQQELSIQKQKLYIKLNKLDKAINEIEKLIQTNPNEISYYGMLAELYLANKLDEKAFETYQKALKIEPDNPYIQLFLSNYYQETGDKEKSFEALKKAFSSPELDINPKVNVLLPYYTLTEKSDDYKQQAFSLLDVLIQTHPKEADAFAIYGDFLYRDKKLKEAKENYLKAIELNKDKFIIWNQILVIDAELNDYEAMLKESKEALELFPNEPSVYLLNSIANIQLKNSNEAIATLTQGVKLVVENNALLAQFYSSLGDAYYNIKQYVESDQSYDKALELNPENTYVLNNYSYYLSLRNSRLEDAESMSKKSNELDPTNASYQDTYAWILYQMGKYDEAKVWLEKALSNGGDKTDVILEHYGDVLYKLGDKTQALEYWKKAKEVGAGSEFLEKKISTQELIE